MPPPAGEGGTPPAAGEGGTPPAAGEGGTPPAAGQGGVTRSPGSVGLDLLEIARLERALERRPRLAERLFTERELAYAAGRARPGQHLAARFCAKEAVAKALSLDGLNFREIEVVSMAGGVPGVRLTGAAAARAAQLGVDVAVSLSHTDTSAGAVALLR